ncbi:MAG: autotransporter domain-containing protein [Alphaproteobacteria bacterium]|nr:autotransporter domain-containing protein [Alphaproteobacteria bacterium]
MKNNLLLTTAMVATAFVASNAMADEFIRNQNQLDAIDSQLTYISFDNTNGENNLDDLGTLTLKDNLRINGKVTLHDKVTLTGGKNLIVNGYLTQTASGSDISDIDITIGNNTNGAGLIVGNKLTVGNLSVKEGANVNLWKGVEGDKVLTVAGGKKITFEGGSALKFSIDETATTGDKIKGNVELAGKVALDVDVSHVTSANKPYTFIDGNVTGEGDWTHNLTNSIFNVSVSEGKNALEFAAKSAGEIASSIGANSNQAGTIAAVITGGDTGNTTFDSVAKEITSLAQTNPSAAIDAATALAPEVNPMVQQVQTSTLSQVFSAISSRMSGGSLASSGNGMSSGDNVFEKAAMWVKGLFNKSKLDTENGFDADSEGLAFGFEKNVKDDVKAGVAYAYTKTDVDGFMRTTDVDTHTLALYGEYKPADWFVNATMSYGWSDYSENKNVAGVNVNADYDAETFGLQAMAGYETEYKDYKVTPEAGLRYVHVKQDSYTDTAGQNISSDDLDVVTAVVGAKATRNWELENGTVLKPEVRAALTYDVIDADNSSVVTLANGSAYTVEGEGLDRLGFEFGAGISADVNEKIEITVGYEGKFREDYQDHTGMLNAKYKF